MISARMAQPALRRLVSLLMLALLIVAPLAPAFAQAAAPSAPVAAPTSPVVAQPAEVMPNGAGQVPAHNVDLSIWGLFWSAHIVVKLVMIGLLVSSIWVWAIAIDKTLLYMRTKKAMDRFEQTFWSGQSLEELYRTQSARPAHSMAALFVAAMREWKRSFEGTSRAIGGLQMRIEKVMDVTIAREVERLERRLLVLATIGSAGPFIGLFGTVWGIMTSFQSIAASKNTSLAVVAPGIAEALFATAIGLVAAIPATIFYNKFVSEVNKQTQRLEGFADEFSAILSRQIDEAA
jgi:biopolymer transport protein TolQ